MGWRGQAHGFFRVFAAGLACAALILGGVLLRRGEGPGTDDGNGASAYFPSPSDRLTLLAFGLDETGAPETCLLIGFLPDRGQLAVCALPPGLLLPTAAGETSLAAAFLSGGAAYAAQCVSDYLAVPVDRFAAITPSGFERIMAAGGVLEFALTPEMYPAVPRGSIRQGKVALDAALARSILTYPDYPGGERARSDKAAILVSRLLAFHLTGALTDTGGKLFAVALDSMQTDLSEGDYAVRQPAAAFLAGLDRSPAAPLFLDGAETRGAFRLSDSSLSRIRSVF